jgi:hypothetical protein
MIRAIHYIAGGAAICFGVLFIIYGAMAQQLIDPDLDHARRTTVWLISVSAGRHDFVGQGWHFRKLQWLWFGLLCVAIVVWGASS